VALDATVVIATFGGPEWIDLAQSRAIPSTAGEAPYIHAHGDTLAEARNTGLDAVETEWVIHLDADDELEPGYVDALSDGVADLRAPSVRYVQDGRTAAPRMPRVAGHRHECAADCLAEGNWLVVGTAVPTKLAQQVGWRDWPVYEDWDFFLRCWRKGATVEPVPEAVYRAHVRPDSRNRSRDIELKNRVHVDIFDSVFKPAQAA
jgi:glycosyltransferase involved in cell wall biosynthesis